MKNSFFNNSLGNIYSKPSVKSEITSQIIYGEKFKILSKTKNWFKIRTSFDRYTGYIKRTKFYHKFNPSNKISTLKTRIFREKENKFYPTNKFLYFGSGISVINRKRDYIKFEKNKWIKRQNIKKINFREKNFIKIFKLFLNTKYLWGGKTTKGIDCSALIQIYFYYNRIYFPRDSKDQLKFCKKNNKNKLSLGDIVFWKGHVGICINKSKFIHAYGPKKKVVIMPTNYTIDLIKKTADLKIKKVSNILNY